MTADGSADPVLARRAAVATICEAAARSVIERVVGEAAAAANLFGLTHDRAQAYGDGILSTMPAVLSAMRMPDSPEREEAIGQLARDVRSVSRSHHIPPIVERGLTAIAVRIAREVVRRGAAQQGFKAEELEREFVAFADQLEARLFTL